MISPIPSHPQTAGNRVRVFQLANAIRGLGHELHFAHVQFEVGDKAAMAECWGEDSFFSIPYMRPRKLSVRIRRKLRSLFDKEFKYISYIDAWYDDALDYHLKQLYREYVYDMVIVEYVFFSKSLNSFPDRILKIIDTHDVMTNRHRLYLQNNSKYNWFSTTSAQERIGLRRGDIIIAIQENERESFRRLVGKKIITICHSVTTRKPEAIHSTAGTLLFIGSANQSNIDAIQYFIGDIFPIVRTAVPQVKLMVVGPVCRAIENGSDDGIISLGVVDNLDAVYAQGDVVINPIRFGTGLKIKNIEALGYAKPLVTTSVGAEGMEEGIGSAFLVADDPQKFANDLIRLLEDGALFQRLSENSYEFAVAWNQRQLMELQSILDLDKRSVMP